MVRQKPLEEGAWYVVDLATKKAVGHAFKTEKGAWAHALHLNACYADPFRKRRREFGIAQAKRAQ